MSAIFNLYKYSMGSDWMDYRPEYQWFLLDNILDGSDERWKDLVSKNPSLSNVAHHVIAEYNRYVNTFSERYNIQLERVKDFYNMYIGYHPRYGAYMVGIGPYVGTKPEDEANKFGYFTMRFPSTDSKNIIGLWSKFIMGHPAYSAISDALGLKSLIGIVEPEDFKMQIRHKTGEIRGTKQMEATNYELIDLTPEFLEENDYDTHMERTGDQLHRTLLGTTSYFFIKPTGIAKILLKLSGRYGQKESLSNVVRSVATKMGIPESQINERFMNDVDFSKKVCNEFAKINPLAKDIDRARVSGSQRTEALKPSTEQKQILKLMKEICEIIVNHGDDLNLIADKLNVNRGKAKTKAKGVFTPEIVRHWLSQIENFRVSHDENGNIIKQRSYAEMPKYFQDNLDNIRLGFDDMETALKITSLRFAESKLEDIDPVTRAKLVSVPSKFEMPSNVNLTSDDLSEMRSGKGILHPVEEQDISEDMSDDLGEEVLVKDEIEVDPVKTENLIDDPELTEELEEDAKMSKTINDLIKLSNDFDKEGHYASSYCLKKIIKKYKEMGK